MGWFSECNHGKNECATCNAYEKRNLSIYEQFMSRERRNLENELRKVTEDRDEYAKDKNVMQIKVDSLLDQVNDLREKLNNAYTIIEEQRIKINGQ